MMINNFPKHASVVIIGGGVMGCSTMYHLAKKGIKDVVLIEQNKLTSGTTWHSAAQVRALRSSQNLTDLIRYSIDLYSTLEEETGQNVGWINKGSISIATNQDRLIHIKRQEQLAKIFGVRSSEITPDEVKEMWPILNVSDVIGAVWSPDDGRVSPSDLCSALVKGAKSKGAKVYEDTRVTGITTKGSKISSVITSRGDIKCDAIALCTGLWSKEVAGFCNTNVPVWPCEHFYILTKPIEGISGNLPTLSDHDGHLYIRDDSGGLLVGCFEPKGKSISPSKIGNNFAFQLLPEDWDHFEPMMINALHRLPALEKAEIKMLLNGPESFTPDGTFLLGETAETSGLFLGCGMNSFGVASGGGAGMALAECIIEGKPPRDLHELDPKRFPNCFNSAEALAERMPEVLGKHYAISYPNREWDTSRNLKFLPLHKEWENDSACFGQAFGYERPLYFNKKDNDKLTFDKPFWFENVKNEVLATSKNIGLLEQSSFGKIEVSGKQAENELNKICTNDLSIKPGKVKYSLILDKYGGIQTDLIVVRLNEDLYRLYVGTNSIKKNISLLNQYINEKTNLKICDVTDRYAVIGIMGPKSKALMECLNCSWLNEMPYFTYRSGMISDIPVEAVRVSYIGEFGWEITVKSRFAKKLYSLFKKEGISNVGSYAMTSMRIEKGFVSYGHDINTDSNPKSANLDFLLDYSKNFIGKEQLEKNKLARKESSLVSLVFDDQNANPIANEPVFFNEKIIGITTSASFGFRINKPIALANIKAKFERVEKNIKVNIAGVFYEARVSLDPPYDPNGNRMKN